MEERTITALSSYAKTEPTYWNPREPASGGFLSLYVCGRKSARYARRLPARWNHNFCHTQNNDELPNLGVSIMETPKFGRLMIRNIRTKLGREPPRATRAGFQKPKNYISFFRCPAPRKRCGTPFLFARVYYYFLLPLLPVRLFSWEVGSCWQKLNCRFSKPKSCWMIPLCCRRKCQSRRQKPLSGIKKGERTMSFAKWVV